MCTARCAFLVSSLILTAAPVAAAQAPATEIRYLSGTDKDHTVPWQFTVSGGRRAGERTTIPVPSNWELQGFGTYNYGQPRTPKSDEVGRYRHEFDVPASWKGRRIQLVFEGSMTDTSVRVNGRAAGPDHQGGFYEFSYDVTPLVHAGAGNVLEVTVSKQSANASVNRAERDGDFWVFGGIYRPVYLAAMPAQCIERLAIDARADGSIRTDVFLHGVAAETHVTAQVQTLTGEPVGEAFSSEAAPGADRVTLRSRIANPRTWNAETPALYRLDVTLAAGGAPLHAVVERFGFRTIEVRRHDGLYVNGVRVLLKGVNRHSSWPESGRTTSPSLSIADVQLMKDMNMNAVRMSHYPPDRHFLEACDELGLYVLDELTGWQANYDTPTGERLVGELVRRDVNHPSILFWDNGNEGGFNRDLDDDFATWDPQGRVVLHPWENFNGIDTLHYAPYDCCAGQFFHGRDLIMPTEFMHGLYDGGLGAGLRDYWDLIARHPLGAGGFLWVFADEGVVRTDRGGAIDTAGSLAPDGILGPHREKEASFFTIKQLWSPVWIDVPAIPDTFDGRLPVENRYSFTGLEAVTFKWELQQVRQPWDADAGHIVVSSGRPASPRIAPGDRGALDLGLPVDWRQADALALTAADPTGRDIYTWRWMLRTPAEIAARIVRDRSGRVSAREEAGRLIVESGDAMFTFDLSTGRLAGSTTGGRIVSFGNGPRGIPDDGMLQTITHAMDGDSYVIRATYGGTLREITWRVRPGGWLTLDYRLQVPGAAVPYIGITFDYAEAKVTGMKWLGKGPYRVWKNRLDGVTPDVWTTAYNDTVTGASWVYPEFKGHYADVYWASIGTTEAPITIVSETEGLFLRMLTPRFPADARTTAVAFPDGDISLLHAIAPIGTKFYPASVYGPASQLNLVNDRTGVYEGRVHFHVGALVPEAR